MKYLRMDALLIKADIECLNPENNVSFSHNMIEKYNKVISINQHKDYFEAMTRETYPGCIINTITIRVSQNDEYGKTIIDPAGKESERPLWEVVYP